MSQKPLDPSESIPAEFAELEVFSRQLNNSLRLETVCETLADGVQELLHADRCAIFLLDRATADARCVLRRGLTADYTATVAKRYRSLPGRLLGQRRFLMIEDAVSDAGLALIQPLVQHEGFRSMLLVSLAYQEQDLGAFGAYFDEQRQFDDAFLALAQTVANQAAVALVNARSYRLVEQRVDELEKLRQAAVEINGQPDLESTLRAVTSRAADLLGAESSYVYLHDAERNELVVRAAFRAPEAHLGRRIKVGEGLAGRVFEARHAQIVGDYLAWEGASTAWRDVSFGTVLAVPLLVGDEPIGVLTLNDDVKNRVFDDESMRVAGLFASLAAAALTSALFLADSRRRASGLTALQRVAALVTATLDLPTVLQVVVEELHTTFGFALTSIHRLQGETLMLQARAGMPLQSPVGRTLQMGQGIIGRAARTATVQYVADVSEDRDFVPILPTIVAEAAMPILLDERVWGVLNVETADQETLTLTDVPLLGMFCQQISVAIRNAGYFADQAAAAQENARLYQLEAKRRQLADTLRQLASAVSSMIDFEQAATTILEYLARVVALDSASVLVEEGDHFRIIAHVVNEETPWTTTELFQRGELISAEQVFHTGQPLMIPDTATSDIWRRDVGRAGIGSWLGLPVRFHGQPFGVLSVDRNLPGSFSLADILIVKAFADQAATGLANVRLFEAEARRAEENERLREFNENLIRSVETGILLEGSDDTIQYVNPRLCHLVGYDEADLVGQPSAMLLSPEMSAWVDRKAAGRRSGETGRYEAALLRRDGHQVPVLVSATPLFENGLFTGTLTAFMDITQRKRIEKTLWALNSAAAAVRQATAPHQVYQTIADEVAKLGFSLVALNYDASQQKLRLEQFSPVGRLVEIASYWTPWGASDVTLSVELLPEFERVLATGQAEFFAAPNETISMAVLMRQGIPRDVAVRILGQQRAVLAPVMNQDQAKDIFVILGENLSEEDLPAFEAFANQAAAALDNARLLAAERRERERAEALAKVASILNSTPDLADALSPVMGQLHSLLQFDNCALFVVHDGTMVCQAAEGTHADWWFGMRLPLANIPLFQEMMAGLETILVSDCHSDPRWVGSPATEHLASWIGAPLVVEGQLVGMLSVDKAQRGFFAAEHRDVMTAFADQLSVAVQRAHHFNDAQQRLREVASLAQVSALLTEAPDLDAVLEVVLDSVCELLGAERGAIALTRQQNGQLHIGAARGYGPSFAPAISEAELNVPRDLTRGPGVRLRILVAPGAPATRPEEYLTSAALVLSGRVIGLIEVEQPAPNDAQRRLLAAVADLAAVAIDKAQLYQDTVRAYEELRDLDRLKDEFVQNVSHELRTPLTFVKGYVEYLLEGYGGPLNDGQREALDIVLDRSNAIIRMVNDIVSLKRAEMQEMDVQPVAVELIALACVEGSRLAAEHAGIQIQLDLPSDLPMVYGDSKRLGQVFDHLLDNAIKFSPDGGVIAVRLYRRIGVVEIAISDTGIGMPADRLEHIWERFYQIDGASTRRFSGVGLGLPIAKRIIDAHDGRIWAESKPSEGSTFHFTLPICLPDGEG